MNAPLKLVRIELRCMFDVAAELNVNFVVCREQGGSLGLTTMPVIASLRNDDVCYLRLPNIRTYGCMAFTVLCISLIRDEN